MDWIFITFIAIFSILVMAIIIFLIALLKQGDERYKHIKTNAITNSFYGILGVLILELLQAIFTNNQTRSAISYLSLLIVIAVIFLVSLFFANKKYGG